MSSAFAITNAVAGASGGGVGASDVVGATVVVAAVVVVVASVVDVASVVVDVVSSVVVGSRVVVVSTMVVGATVDSGVVLSIESEREHPAIVTTAATIAIATPVSRRRLTSRTLLPGGQRTASAVGGCTSVDTGEQLAMAVRVDRTMATLTGRRLVREAHAVDPRRGRTDRSGDEAATAVRAHVVQDVRDTRSAEGALVRADHCVGRAGREIGGAVLADGAELQHAAIVAAGGL
jgi:hypothetical protein